eukprot:GHVS01064066.1.p4 GENE.GHVS01064066.1~~GHVS01064066.1.p4  ORF type:complete len:109 (+),score=10.35 GHVS01064066.1:787-1113(+)
MGPNSQPLSLAPDLCRIDGRVVHFGTSNGWNRCLLITTKNVNDPKDITVAILKKGLQITDSTEVMLAGSKQSSDSGQFEAHSPSTVSTTLLSIPNDSFKHFHESVIEL